jgi:superfamily II DNA/RNA helicase
MSYRKNEKYGQSDNRQYKNNNVYDKRKNNGKYNNNNTFEEEKKSTELKYDYSKNEEGLIDLGPLLISKELEGTNITNFCEIADEDKINIDLIRGLTAYGFDEPSLIQQYAIKPIVNGRDILAQSSSGTGKTGAFSIGILQSIDENLKKPQVIIISPTGDLADQTLKFIKAISSYMNIKISYTVGGVDRKQNIQELTDEKEICQLIIATPGRLLDIITAEPKIKETIKMLVIDEFDELLTGFKDAMKQIYSLLPHDMQSCFFSATLTQDVLDLSNKILRNPLKILLKKDDMTLDEITQTYINCETENDKMDVIKDLTQGLNIEQFMIYVNTIEKSVYVYEELKNFGFDVCVINGQMEKYERNEIIKNFKKGQYKCLISTDLLSRGIDIAHLFLVINYDLPDDPSKYIHRIGRSGRFGKKGLSINLVNKNNASEVQFGTIIISTFKCQIINFNDYYQKFFGNK